MKRIAGEALVQRLLDWGVDTVFGLPGDGINGVMEGLRRHKDALRFVLVHHEEAAAFMATGYAKLTGKPGVCIATSGPGGLHLINGLYDAKLDHAPVVAITGAQPSKLLGTGHQQEVHLEHTFADVAEYNAFVHVPVQIPALVDQAMRTAITRRSVSHITIPIDVQEAVAGADPFEGGMDVARTPAQAAIVPSPPAVPRLEDLRRAASILNQAERPVMLVGAGALGARDEILLVADRLGSPIVKTLPGKAAVPDDNPLTTGGIGLLGTRPSLEVMEQADVLLMVGTSFPYTHFLPEHARVIQIDNEPSRAGARIPTELPLVGDAADTLRALAPTLERRTDRRFLASAQHAADEWRRHMEALENPDRTPIQPEYLVRALDRHAADDAILAGDAGTVTIWAARHFDMRGDRRFVLSGNLATMACGLPYSIAAQAAYPGRQCLAFVGDGGFAMLMAEFLTAARYGFPVKIVVSNNGALGMIQWEQLTQGFPEFGVRFERPASFAPWAEACGGLGIRVENPHDVDAAIHDALAHPGPALVDAIVNADEPPLPPKVEVDEAAGLAKAFLRGQPRRGSITSTVLKDRVDQLKS